MRQQAIGIAKVMADSENALFVGAAKRADDPRALAFGAARDAVHAIEVAISLVPVPAKPSAVVLAFLAKR